MVAPIQSALSKQFQKNINLPFLTVHLIRIHINKYGLKMRGNKSQAKAATITTLFILISISFMVLFVNAATCGDLNCESGETYSNCPDDCCNVDCTATLASPYFSDYTCC
jgi:hypothetical protein